jgi:hypothetical protein
MESCLTCKSNSICKWKGEAKRLLNETHIYVNPDSPFSIVLYCGKFERSELND